MLEELLVTSKEADIEANVEETKYMLISSEQNAGQNCSINVASGVPRNFVQGVQQIYLRTEDRENRDLGAVAPIQGFWRQL